MKGRSSLRILSLSAALLFTLLCTAAYAGHDNAALAFSDPEFIMEMEPGWDQRPLTYTEQAQGAVLSIIVNQQVDPAITPLVNQFAKERNMDIRITIGTCGTSAGALSRKEVDMGGFCCPPGEIDRLPGLAFHTLGITPIVLFVHPSNPVDNVTLAQARMLMAGQITNWSSLGGKDEVVRPTGMLHCAKRPGHWRLLLEDANSFAPGFQVTGDIQDTLSVVASTTGGIGFEIPMNIKRFDMMDKVKILFIDGHDPRDLKRLADNVYPLYRTMNVTTWSDPKLKRKAADELVRFMLDNTAALASESVIVPAAELRKKGWKFKEDELIGEPHQ